MQLMGRWVCQSRLVQIKIFTRTPVLSQFKTCRGISQHMSHLKNRHLSLGITNLNLGVTNLSLGVPNRNLKVTNMNMGVTKLSLGLTVKQLKSVILIVTCHPACTRKASEELRMSH